MAKYAYCTVSTYSNAVTDDQCHEKYSYANQIFENVCENVGKAEEVYGVSIDLKRPMTE